MTSNAEKREQVLWQMVSYLQGVVDATIGDEPVKSVGYVVSGFYEQLDELRDEPYCTTDAESR